MWWSITCVLLCLVICQTAVTLPTGAVASEEVAAASAIIPETQEDALLSEADREKRALEAKTQAKFGLKTYLLDLIFGKINKAIDSKTGLIGQLDRLNIEKNKNLLKPPCDTSSGAAFAGYPASSGGLPPSSSVSASAGTQTRTDDIPDFDRNKVSLDIPGELFGSSVNLVTRGSKAVGDVIMNAAQRVQRFIEALKPTVGGKLGITATRTRRQHGGSNYDTSPDLNTVDTTR